MNGKDSVLLDTVFDRFIKHGAQMFIGMRLAPTEEQHAAVYYGFMQPKNEAVIVDLGCGVGGCGYYLQQINPTLRVINVVNAPSLIAYMKQLGRECIEAPFESTGLPDNIADNVMFNESMGHGDLDAVLAEAARLLKDGGTLTIKDFSPLDHTKKEIVFEEWGYRVKRPDLVLGAAYRYGFHVEVIYHPYAYTEHAYGLIGKEPDVQRAMGTDRSQIPICQTLYKFTKGGLSGRT